MLQALQIKNLALVDSLQVEFRPGLNVITGETGAGKSIIVGALSLLLGERADKSVIREGESQCVIEAEFHLEQPQEINAILQETGIDPCVAGHLVIRRLVASSGSGRQFVNNCSVTLQILKQIGAGLVDMHGPHDHQSLFSPEFQLSLLDAFGDLGGPRQAYRQEYDSWQAWRDQRRVLEADDQDTARQIDMLAFQVQELEAAALREDEEAAVVQEQTMLGNAQQILQLADTARQALTEGDTCAFAGLVAAQQALGELAALVEPAGVWKDEAKSTAVQIQELVRNLDSFMQKIEGDPDRLLWLDERMGVYQKMKRKYGATVAEIMIFLERSQQKLHDLRTRGEQIAKLDTALAATMERLEAQGRKLRTKRKATARRLAKAVIKELKDLGFGQASFTIALHDAEAQGSGMDGVEFGFTPNPGEPERALRAIASSGEISRVMLAIKTVFADHDLVPVLVFDEIDVNVGGKMGQAIGVKLAEIARRRQVLCITHLPQVAVHGTVQFAVTKQTRDGRTLSAMFLLSRERRIEEIARMLGGRDLTSVTLKHAREMLEKAPRGDLA